jgi:hypothetical protein
MSLFLSALGIEELDAVEVSRLQLDPTSEWFRLTEPLLYQSDLGGMIHVPAGFVTDFASTPRLVWALIPPEDVHYTRGAVVHDWLYNQHSFPKPFCDAIFLEAMTSLGCAKWKRLTMYQAVKWFGSAAYNNERKQCISMP